MSNTYEVACRFLEEFKKTCDCKKGYITGEVLNRLALRHLMRNNYTPGLCKYVYIFDKVRLAVAIYILEYFDSSGEWEETLKKNKDKRLAEFEAFLEENKTLLKNHRDEFPSL